MSATFTHPTPESSHPMKTLTRTTLAAATLGVAALTLTACAGAGAGAEDKTVSIGYVPWDEVTAVTYLWKNLLEEDGYTVNVTQLEPAAVYAAVAQNDMDLFMAAIPETQGDYWDEFGENFESVVEWYAPLRHGLVVPEYVDAESIKDLEGKAGEFNGQIVGIEPGAGLMQETTAAQKAYDLEGYEVVEGSSAAMLAAFERAQSANEPIVAAAWNPHWAVGEFNMKFLEDPENVYTDGGIYHVIASQEAQQKEELISSLKNFAMTDADLMPLLTELKEAGTGNEDAAVETWLQDEGNRALADGWIGTE